MKRFSSQEDDFIRDNYLEMTLNELGEKLDRSFGSVYGRMNRLGLKVPEQIKTERFVKSYQKLAETGKANRFVKGQIPPNKGKRMLPEVYAKCSKSMFKKGNIPHTQVHNGQPYLYSRKRKNGYVEKLWFIQEGVNKRSAYLAFLCRQNGIDLTGKKPRLKPGFDHSRPPTMDDIVIVSEAENMLQNSYLNMPDEVVSLIKAKIQLTQIINKKLKNE